MGILTFKDKVTLQDIQKDLKLSNRGILRILQEVANNASSLVNHGVTDINATHTTWILIYWRVKILNRAEFNDELTINTWTCIKKKLYSLRNFEIYNGDELVAIVDSKWVYVDANTHSILKIPEEFEKLYSSENKDIFETEFKDKAKMPENLEKKYSYTTMKRDLDGNSHVNNIAFLDIANEVIDDKLICNSTEFSIQYKKELHYNDTVSCYTDTDDEGNTAIYICNAQNDNLSCVIKIK